MKGGFGNIMQQAQKMQEGLQKIQEEIANAEVTGESGAGLVRVVMTGRHDVKHVEIDPGLLSDEKEILEDFRMAMTQEKMTDFTSGMGLPAGMKLPF